MVWFWKILDILKPQKRIFKCHFSAKKCVFIFCPDLRLRHNVGTICCAIPAKIHPAPLIATTENVIDTSAAKFRSSISARWNYVRNYIMFGIGMTHSLLSDSLRCRELHSFFFHRRIFIKTRWKASFFFVIDISIFFCRWPWMLALWLIYFSRHTQYLYMNFKSICKTKYTYESINKWKLIYKNVFIFLKTTYIFLVFHLTFIWQNFRNLTNY